MFYRGSPIVVGFRLRVDYVSFTCRLRVVYVFDSSFATISGAKVQLFYELCKYLDQKSRLVTNFYTLSGTYRSLGKKPGYEFTEQSAFGMYH